jgi:hypothetical protein
VSTFALLFLTGMRAEETRELQAGVAAAPASASGPTTS